MDDLSRFCCLNPDCSDHGKRGNGNLTVPMRYGPHRTRLLRCSTCQSRFSERKGTPLFDTRLSPDTVTAVLAQVAEGSGVPHHRRRVNAVACKRRPRSGASEPGLRGDHQVSFTPEWSAGHCLPCEQAFSAHSADVPLLNQQSSLWRVS